RPNRQRDADDLARCGAGAGALGRRDHRRGCLNGWEIQTSNAATPSARVLIDDGANQAVVSLATSSATLDEPHFVMLAFDGADLIAASEASSGTSAFAFNPTSSTPAGIGAYRATSPEITPNA